MVSGTALRNSVPGSALSLVTTISQPLMVWHMRMRDLPVLMLWVDTRWSRYFADFLNIVNALPLEDC
jgi:hypothetical protein